MVHMANIVMDNLISHLTQFFILLVKTRFPRVNPHILSENMQDLTDPGIKSRMFLLLGGSAIDLITAQYFLVPSHI